MSGLRPMEHHDGAARDRGNGPCAAAIDGIFLPAHAPVAGHGGGGPAAAHRHRRVRPHPGRGRLPRVHGAPGRGPGDRQVHAHAPGGGPPGAGGESGAVCVRRGIPGAGKGAGDAPGRGQRIAVASVRNQSGEHPGGGPPEPAQGPGAGLHTDGVQGGPARRARLRGPSPGMRGRAFALGQGGGDHGFCPGARDQGGRSGRPPCAGAHRGHGAIL